MGSLQNMLLRSAAGLAARETTLLSAYEAEQLIEQLKPTSIEQVGNAQFTRQHDAISKLNLQAHWNAEQHTDEFVMDLLVSLDKVSLLVQELLVIEAWKDKLYPLLQQHLADHVDSSIAYLVLYHEAAVANLLEVVLYHRTACEALDEDCLLELTDWAVRKLAYLNTDAHKQASTKERSVQELLAMTSREELEQKKAETDFAAATCGLTILRYLTDHITNLPLGVMSRLLRAHDTVMALLPLVDSPPWVRDKADGKLEKFINGKWQIVPPADRLKITQLDGQVWLCVVNLLVEPACRAKYNPDGFRKGCILRLQRHLNELLLDQLPVLRQLARVLDEMSLGVNSAAADGYATASRLILEQVPVLRESLLRGKDWRTIAKQQKQQQFGAAAKALARQQLESMMQSFELLCQIEAEHEQQQQQQQQQQSGAIKTAGNISSSTGSLLERGGADEAEVLPSTVRVVCSRQVHASGLWEHWCEFTARLDACKPSEPVSISTSATGSNTTSSGGSSSTEGTTIDGRRYRLQPMQDSDTRALPTNGKVAVHFMGCTAEALLQLPEVPFSRADAAEAAGAPPGLWLTVGLLAADGFALQLCLRMADKPKERDRVEGGWFAYHPVGGAITVLCKRHAGQVAAGGLPTPAQSVTSVQGLAGFQAKKPQGSAPLIQVVSSSNSSSQSRDGSKACQRAGTLEGGKQDTVMLKP